MLSSRPSKKVAPSENAFLEPIIDAVGDARMVAWNSVIQIAFPTMKYGVIRPDNVITITHIIYQNIGNYLRFNNNIMKHFRCDQAVRVPAE